MGVISADTLIVGDKENYETKEYMRYRIADSLYETFFDVEDRVWSQHREGFGSFENLGKSHWARLCVKNRTDMQKEYYLVSENQMTHHIEYFLLKDGQLQLYQEDGRVVEHKNRPFNLNKIIFPLILAPQEEVELFFKIKNYNNMNLDFKLQSESYLLDYFQTYNIVEGILFGIMLAMLLYNLIIYTFIKDVAYLYYVFYLFFLITYFLGLFGFFYRYFPDYIVLFNISTGGFLIFMVKFIQSILNIKKELPFGYRLLNIFLFYLIFNTIIMTSMIVTEEFFYAQILLNILLVMILSIVITIIFITYYLAYTTKSIIAKLYAYIWTMSFFLGILLPLFYLNILSFSFPIDYLFHFIMVVESLMFSLMLAFRIKEIERDKERQQSLLVQQNRLASMGEMIVNIAHQWRQPLSEINGQVLNIDMDYRKKILTDKKMEFYLDSIENTTKYMSDTINDFMNFFSTNKVLEEFSLVGIFEQSHRIISMSLSKEIEIIYHMNRDILILGYRSELIQALLIVINNGVDACGHASKIVIDTVDNEESVTIKIKDNGGGIPNNILPYIFDPYFTTKHQSQGTGLGLYILKMIVEKSMSGKVEIKNHPDGVLCTIKIPKRLTKSNRLN
jgi:signal transduction histidine kinase